MMKTHKRVLIISASAFVVAVAIVLSALYFSGIFDILKYEVNYESGQLAVMSAWIT